MSGARVTHAPGGTWWPARRRFALLALLTGALTAALVARMGGPDWHVDLALVYVSVVGLALFSPAAIALQVIAGQVAVASVLVGRDSAVALLLVPALAGVVATAELLALVARLDSPVERRPRGELRRASVAVVVGSGVYAAIALAAPVPGPTGLVAVGLAAAACALLAALLRPAVDAA